MAAAQYFEQVQKIFIAFYQRPADPAGLKYWAERVDVAGGDLGQVIDAFATSPEALGLYGAINATTIGTVIDKLYLALFNKAPDAAGKQFYVDGFTAGTFTAGTIALNVLNGATGNDKVAVNNKVQVANDFTQQVDGRALTDAYFGTGSSFNATYSGDADTLAARDILKGITFLPSTVLSPADVTAAIQTQIANAGDPIIGQGGQNYTLSVNQDTATAHTFDAPIFTSTQTGNQIQTLTSVDKLTGTAATDDVLNAILNGTEVATKPTMSGVEKVNLTAIAASVFDAANSTGITEIGSVDSNSDLTVRNLAAGATVVVKNTAVGADTQVQFANAVASGTSDVATIKVDGVGRGATAGNTQILNVRGETAGSFETLNIESTGGASRFANIGSDATVAVAVAPVAATSLVKTVNVTGTANLRVDNALLNVTTLDANAFEGNLRVVLDTTKNVTVTGGKGADYFDFFTGLSNLDTVNGGDGRDTIAVTTNAGLGDGNKVTNVEILRNDGAANATIFDLAKVASFDAVVHNSGNTATYNNFVKAGAADAAKGLTILGTGNVTVAVKDANALGSNSDALYVNVGSAQNTAAFAAGTVTTAAIEKIVVDVKDAGANTATAGAQPFVNADAAIGTVEFKGGSLGVGFNAGAIGGSGVGLTNIDGSAFVGNLTVSGNAFSQVIKGGSGNDTIATGGRAAYTLGTVADTLTGNGGNDIFSFADQTDGALKGANVTAIDAPAAVTATNRGEIVTITDLNLGGANAGTRVDTIDFSGGAGATFELSEIAAGGFSIVNGGAATALTGLNLGAALDAAIANTGILGSGTVTTNGAAGNAANFAKAGLFTWAGDTYLVATSNGSIGNTFGAVAGEDIIIKVTGVVGTLDVSDFV